MNEASQQTNQIRRFAAIIGVSMLVVLIFRSSFATMWDLWQRSSHQHGVLILPISAYLIWRISPRLAALHSSWSFLGFAALAMVSSFWLIGRLAGVQLVEHFSALALIPAAVLALCGMKIFRVAMFPLLLVLLATPISDSFVPFLMTTTADLSTAMLRATGYAVWRSGQHLSLPGGDFVVAKVCSGVRYLMAGTTIALLFSYLSFSSRIKRLVFVAVMVAVLVLANGFRAFAIMAIGSSSNMRYMAGADHVYFGWALFGLVMFAAMWLGSYYIDESKQTQPDNESNIPASSAISGGWLIVALGVMMLVFTFNPLGSESVEHSKGLIGLLALISLFVYVIVSKQTGRTRLWGSGEMSAISMARVAVPWAAVGCFLVLVPFAESNILKSTSSSVEYVNLYSIRSCSPRNRWSEAWTPSFKSPAVELGVTLTCGTIPVSAYVAAYSGNVQDHELISGANRAVPRNVQIDSEATVNDLNIGGSIRKVRELLVKSPTYHGLIWLWYDIDGRIATSESVAKFYQLLALVRGRPAGGQIVLISTRVNSDVNDARNRLRQALTKIVLEADQTLISGLP